jgi:hypothetical protein
MRQFLVTFQGPDGMLTDIVDADRVDGAAVVRWVNRAAAKLRCPPSKVAVLLVFELER